MKGLRVSQGKWKGKEIPTPPDVSGHLNFTNSLVKKAIFSLMDSRLLSWGLGFDSVLFCDYFAGSGQISAEAYSLSVKRLLTYELDQTRFRQLHSLFRGLAEVQLFRKDATKHALKWDLGEELAYIFYLDPPYTYWSETPARMKEMLEGLYAFCLSLQKPFLILCQIPEHQPTAKIWTDLPHKVREYGSHFIIETGYEDAETSDR
ncbi:RsmD family RNA methyltransferase [Leptospira sp. 2 VSF19]|uniref:RsmD family RNA methyltransferase n=1 Tax=Leptospira soteropolitanensis TaxID=2950025 RepID=A0AAW5VFL9_9LEPT|nr:RsmD family RNA methyltransferase [Leptospira soteropolitanensis]MCW7494065.1 RsmD family RNA methyltransferase [Leptospira soteropolitanensis]MCW7501669.1 RsmD family RNA methyltransferase [Leptospira soteropolitanensis]MCW7523911.1 RsmD family RNA methyltransferase [Leptospira soteropolitanensis]MCW7527776.1 RsmD family RNA methyltransferase [Leptospira soteropolitanensis]MCW7531639.1 RsmD family RNA methyltransferase [Leptospira soteropolitanensis]